MYDMNNNIILRHLPLMHANKQKRRPVTWRHTLAAVAARLLLLVLLLLVLLLLLLLLITPLPTAHRTMLEIYPGGLLVVIVERLGIRMTIFVVCII